MILEIDYNYIRPNFQGPNNNVNACLSDLVIHDLDAAIDWISKFPNVDKTKIILIGSSGGGYTALEVIKLV